MITALILIGTIILIRKKHAINHRFDCKEGCFYVKGKKKKFKIKKGNRFVFTIANGQIVSVKDRAASFKSIKYIGD